MTLCANNSGAEFIEAKTHLPLYDLTETTTKWYL